MQANTQQVKNENCSHTKVLPFFFLAYTHQQLILTLNLLNNQGHLKQTL